MAGPRFSSPTVLLWVSAAAIVLGACLRAPLLDNGFRDDDYVQRAMLDGTFAVQRNAADLFWFAGRDAEENARLRDVGYLPWWSAPELRLSMLRPLSSLLMALDHAVFPDDPYVQHLHSLAWWVLLMVAAACVFGRSLPPVAAAIAVLAFALEGAHLIPLAWLANRSTLVASSFAMLALWQHLRWHQDAARSARWLTAGAATLALAGGEYAFSGLGYVVAYELAARPRDPVRVRARALLPVALPCLGYLVLRAALGHGVQHSGYYISPLEPSFLKTGGPRAAALAADLAFGIPALWFNMGGLWQRLLVSVPALPQPWVLRVVGFQLSHVAVGVFAFAVFAALYVWTRRALGDARARTAPGVGWLVLGALMSLVPAASALPSDRVLVGASFGVAALVASALVTAVRRARSATLVRRAPLLALACALAGLHLVLPLYRNPARAEEFARESAGFRLWARAARVPKDGVENVHVMVVSASDFTTAANLPWLRHVEGLGLPRSYRRLSGAFRAHALTLVAPNVLELTVLGQVEGLAGDSLYRSAELALSPGFRSELPGMTVEVLEVRGGMPTRVRFVLDEPLVESRRYLLLHATQDGLVPVRLPPVGGTVQLEVAWFPRLSPAMLEALRTTAAGGSSP